MATKRDRQRQLAREAYQRKLERQRQRQKRTRQMWLAGTSAVLVIALGLIIPTVLGAFNSPAKAKTKAKPAAAASAAPSASPSAAPAPSAIVDGKCVYTKAGTAAKPVSLPPTTPDTTSKYSATIATNRGTVVISLNNAKAPCTVGSFVSLASQKYFNSTPCHRLTTSGIFVLQCGDPTGQGTGGPGYEFPTENLTGATYPAGTVAMANTGQPDSNGSQFFLVYKDTPLPPSYTPFGTVTSGLNVLTGIAAKGTNNANGQGDGAPNESVQIQSVTISKT